MLNQERTSGQGGFAGGLLAEAAGAADAARARIGSAAAELFLAPERKPGDAAQAAMNRLLAGLVAAVEDDLRQRLIAQLGPNGPAALVATLGATDVSIATPILRHARLASDDALVATLLRRVEEERLVPALRAAAPDGPSLLDAFLESDDAPLAAAAAALLAAERRRGDAIDTPLLARADLPAMLRHRLLWWVAAALRHYVLARAALRAGAIDRALIAATTAALAGGDEGETLEARAMHLAHRLHQRRRLDDTLIRRAFGEGRLALAVAALAVRASVDFAAAWEMVVGAGGSRLLVLLRATGVGRGDAAWIACLLAAAEGLADEDGMSARLAAFDLLDAEDAADAIRPWQFAAGYACALSDLADGLASRR